MFFQDSFQSCWKICLECWVNTWTCVTHFIKVWPLLFKVSLDFTLVCTNGVYFLELYSFPRKFSRGMKVGIHTLVPVGIHTLGSTLSYFLGNILVGIRVIFLPDCPLILSLLKYRGVGNF